MTKKIKYNCTKLKLITLFSCLVFFRSVFGEKFFQSHGVRCVVSARTCLFVSRSCEVSDICGKNVALSSKKKQGLLSPTNLPVG